MDPHKEPYKIEKVPAMFRGRAADLFKIGFYDPSRDPEVMAALHAGKKFEDVVYDPSKDDAVAGKFLAELAEAGKQGGEFAFVDGPQNLKLIIAINNVLRLGYDVIGYLVLPESVYVTEGGRCPIGNIPKAEVVAAN